MTSGWSEGVLPANVRLGAGSRIAGPDAFKRYFSKCEIGLSLGERTLDTAERIVRTTMPMGERLGAVPNLEVPVPDAPAPLRAGDADRSEPRP